MGGPKEVSARKKPVDPYLQQCKKLSADINRRRDPNARTGVDPRFNDLYGTYQESKFKHDFEFLRQMQGDEERKRQEELRIVSAAIVRHHAAMEEEEAAGRSDFYNGDDENGGMSAEMEKLLLQKGLLDEVGRVDVDRAKHYKSQLMGTSAKYKQKKKREEDEEHKKDIRRDYNKQEMDAVKEGKKAKPFFMKRKDEKRVVAEKNVERARRQGGEEKVKKLVTKKLQREMRGGWKNDISVLAPRRSAK